MSVVVGMGEGSVGGELLLRRLVGGQGADSENDGVRPGEHRRIDYRTWTVLFRRGAPADVAPPELQRGHVGARLRSGVPASDDQRTAGS
ncbi:hypothetical protein EYF80_025616 [Liparis tanakae]|uniref:Uncharacterized protein n=1 Tax=Liparis tanakae TaxID=230148 RepID=A0A4Z2HE13_9TELE|nr:hypothetical protein EYF80_025616 [Liparis tanakae]